MEGYRFDGRRERYKVLSEDVIEEYFFGGRNDRRGVDRSRGGGKETPATLASLPPPPLPPFFQYLNVSERYEPLSPASPTP